MTEINEKAGGHFKPHSQFPMSVDAADHAARSRCMLVIVDENLHVDSKRLVQSFAEELARKLRAAEEKYGYRDGWLTQDWEAECQQHMRDHIAKGDPRDVAVYCAFMWARGWKTAALPHLSAAPEGGKEDPSADERWNAGLDYAMTRFCQVLGVDPKDVTWDAATEELDGDVCAVIGNILRVKFGDDFDPTQPALASRPISGEREKIARALTNAICEHRFPGALAMDVPILERIEDEAGKYADAVLALTTPSAVMDEGRGEQK